MIDLTPNTTPAQPDAPANDAPASGVPAGDAPAPDATTVAAGHLSAAKSLPVPGTVLGQAHAVFRRWLGNDFDLDALDAMLAAAAVERLDCDPVWLLIISGSGNAKTETVQALDGIAATVTSTISSPGALLSATSARDKAKDATGGLLRKIGGAAFWSSRT